MIRAYRHRVYAMFWTWDYDPFICEVDMESCNGSKNVAQGQHIQLSLYPRSVSVTKQSTNVKVSYKDALNPNDHVFVFVDPLDGARPEPLFYGLIDSVFAPKSVGPDGLKTYRVYVTCTGWEKAVDVASAITSPFVHGNINDTTLRALGPYGWIGRTGRSRYVITGEGVGADIAPSSEGPYTMPLPELIEILVALFLRTSDSEGLQPSQFSDTINRARETEESDLDPMFNGQFELPGTNKPLWDFIRMRFQDIQQRAYTDPRMFLNGATKSLSSMIDSLSNPLINEIFYDVRRTDDDGLSSMDTNLVSEITGGYSAETMRNFVSYARSVNESFGDLVENVAPYMVFRERPLTMDEIMNLDGPEIDERECINMDLGKSDSDLYNLVSLELPSVQMQLIRAQTGFMGFTNYRSRSLESIRKHGLRFYQDNATAWPMFARGNEVTAPGPNPVLLEEWENRMTRAGLDNVSVYSGSVTIPKFIRGLHIGGKLLIRHQTDIDVDTEEYDRVYYVDGYDFKFDASNGSFITSISLSRGYVASQFSRGK